VAPCAKVVANAMPVDEIDVALDHFLEEGRNMGKVVVQASMSLDGFVADTNDQVGPCSTGMATAVEVVARRPRRRSRRSSNASALSSPKVMITFRIIDLSDMS
jgi:hypothetical protein